MSPVSMVLTSVEELVDNRAGKERENVSEAEKMMRLCRIFFKGFPIIVLQAALLLLVLPAVGQHYYGPVSSAMGDSGRAIINPSECIYLNPACIAHYRGYETSVSFSNVGSLLNDQKQASFGFSLADNTGEVLLPASFAYLKRRVKGETGDRVNEINYQLSIARFLIPRLALGLGYQYGLREEEEGDEERQSGHLGFLYTPMHNLGLALVGYNLAQIGYGERSWALGLYYLHTQNWRLSFDVLFLPEGGESQRVNVGGGFETRLNDFVVFRLGFQESESLGGSSVGKWTSGLGVSLPRFQINYSYQEKRSQVGEETHSIDIKIPL